MRPTRAVLLVGGLVVVGGCVVVGALVAACGAGGEGGPPGAPDAFLSSTVGVDATGCSLVSALGSGVVLGEEQVVTSAHTVAGAAEITVVDVEGRSHEAILVGFDPSADLAVLRVPGLEQEPLLLGSATAGEAGWILAWNRAEGTHAIPTTVTKKILVRIEDIYVADIVERSAIELDAIVSHGDSGGAVVTPRGNVVGIVYATSRSRSAGFAVDELEIAGALGAAGVAAIDSGPCT